MKKTLFALIVIATLITGCRKTEHIDNDTATAFTDSYVAEDDGSRDNSFRKTNMKIVIRKVNNATDKYKLVIKVDSVAVDVDGTTHYVNVPGEANVIAGLSIQDPNNMDIDKPIFNKGELNFVKENENGYAVYVSDVFTYTGTLTYGMVRVGLGITTNFAVLLGKPLNFNETETHMVLENGKTVIQNPEPKRMIGNEKNNGSIVTQLTISGDPAANIGSIIFKPNPVKSNVPGQEPRVLLPVELQLKSANINTGVSVFNTTAQCFGYTEGATGVKKCQDNTTGISGTLFLINKNGTTHSSHQVDDWQGETAF